MDRNSSTMERRVSMNATRLVNPIAESTCLNGSPNIASSQWFGSHSPRISSIPRSNSTISLSRVRSVTPTRNFNPSKQLNSGRQKLHLSRIDPRTYADVNSSGLVSRVMKYQDNNKPSLQRSMSANNLYIRPGQFPVVHLKKKELSYKAAKNNVSMTRIAPPDHSIYYGDTISGLLRSSSIIGVHKTDEELSCENRPILHPPPTESDMAPTRSVIEVLKEISRKRINTNDLQHAEAAQKKSCNREYDDLVDGGRPILSTELMSMANQSYKRQREVMSQQHQTMQAYPMLDHLHPVVGGLNHLHTSPEHQQQAKRRQCSYNNDITSSLSSSLKQNSSNKRKLEQVGQYTTARGAGLNHNQYRIGTNSGGSCNSSPETETHIAKIQRKQDELRFDRLSPRPLNCTMPISPLQATSYYSQSEHLTISSDSTKDNNAYTSVAQRSVSAPDVIASKAPSLSPPSASVNVVSNKPKLTLFNKNYEESNTNDRKVVNDLDNAEVEESGECAGINFVKPKKFVPTIKGRNPIIERTQKSKLALMLSGLRGEIYQGESLPDDADDLVDGAVVSDNKKNAAVDSSASKSRAEPSDKPTILSVVTIPAKPLTTTPTTTLTENNNLPASLASQTVTTTATTTIPTSSIQGITPKSNFGSPTSNSSSTSATTTKPTVNATTTTTFNFGLSQPKGAPSTATEGTARTTETAATTTPAQLGTAAKPSFSFNIPSTATTITSSSSTTTTATSITATPTPSFGFGITPTTTKATLSFGSMNATTTTAAAAVATTSSTSPTMTTAVSQTLLGVVTTPMKPTFSFGKPPAAADSTGSGAIIQSSSSATIPTTAATTAFSFGTPNTTLKASSAATNVSSLITFSPSPAAGPTPTFGNKQGQTNNLNSFGGVGAANAGTSSATTTAATATTSKSGLFSFGAGTATTTPATTGSLGGFSFAGAIKNSTTATTTTTTTATLGTNSSANSGTSIFGFSQKPAAVATPFAFGANNTNSSKTTQFNGGGANNTFSFGGVAASTQSNASSSTSTATFSFGGNTASSGAATDSKTNGNTNAIGGTSTFSFGGGNKAAPLTNGATNVAAPSTFTFGGNATATSNNAANNTGGNSTIKPFSFGGSSAAAASANQTTSIFGNKLADKNQQQSTQNAKPAVASIFAFGGNAATGAASTASNSIFGSNQPTTNNSNSASTTPSSKFSFGNGTQKNIFGGPSTTAVAPATNSNSTSNVPFAFGGGGGNQTANKPAAPAAGGFSFSASLGGANNTNNGPTPNIFGNTAANASAPALNNSVSKPSFSFGSANGNNAITNNLGGGNASSFGGLAAAAGNSNNTFAFGSATNTANRNSGAATSTNLFGNSNTTITPIKPNATAPGGSGGGGFSFGSTSSTNNANSTAAASSPFTFGGTNSNTNTGAKPFSFGVGGTASNGPNATPTLGTGANLFDNNQQQSSANQGSNLFNFSASNPSMPPTNIFAPQPNANGPSDRPMRRATRRLQKNFHKKNNSKSKKK